MFFHRLQNRLIILFVTFAAILIFVSGWTLQWMIRRNLETELGEKLISVAGSATVLFDKTELTYMREGGPRTIKRLREKLIRFRDASGVKRIFFFDLAGHSLLDSDSSVTPGTGYFNLRFFSWELEILKKGESVHSILFQGIDGEPTMTGYHPVLSGEEFTAGVAVNGNADFLGIVKRVQYRLYFIGIAGILTAAVLGFIMSRSITGPVAKLAGASWRIGEGHYGTTIPSAGKGEIGLLADTLEKMRRGIIHREQELKAMLASVAHEIRNPLGGIALYAGLLEDETAGNPKAEAHIRRITGETANLQEIVDSFLTYARPREPKPETIPLDGIIRETADLLRQQMDAHAISLDVETEPALSVFADPRHIKRIFLNLLQNGVQAMPDGGTIGIDIRISGQQISIRIRDNGSGIPEKHRREIFTPFFTTREQGTGLGLSIVKQLAEANSGRITLIQSDQNGTVFEVILPSSEK